MALPTLTKTWRFRVNEQIVAQSSQANQCAYQMIQNIDALLGNGAWTDSDGVAAAVSNPWTVVQSNGRVSGLSAPGVNVLTALNEIVWATSGNRWWIVLQNVDGVQLLLASPNNTQYYNIYAAFSIGGLFTGGTATAVPTASDQVVWSTNSGWTHNDARDSVMHVLHSTDGRETRLILCTGGAVFTSWTFGRIRDPEDGIVNPFFLHMISAGATSMPASHAISGGGGMFHGTAANMWMRHGGAAVRLCLTMPGHGSGGSYFAANGINVPNEFQAVPKWPFYEPEVFGYTTVGGRGRAGLVHDFWSGNWNPRTHGDQYPGDGTRQFAQLGYMVWPWNKTLCLVA